MAKCLIIGGDSVLGQSLAVAVRSRGISVAVTTRRGEGADRHYLDLETLEGLEALPSAEFVVIVAAETKLAVCAEEPERTWRINVDAPKQIAHWAAEARARCLFFSSTAVHDMRLITPAEDDPVSPDTAYGFQKLAAEKAVFEAETEVAALRPSKIIDANFPLFEGWLRDVRAGRAITPFSDYKVAPLYFEFFTQAAATLLLARGHTGVFQISTCDETSYEEIARTLVREKGLEEALVQPKLAREVLKANALLSASSAVVSCKKLERLLGRKMPSWRETVSSFLSNASKP